MKLSDNALQVATKRYFYEGFDNNWHDLCVRVGSVIGRIEKDKSYIDKFIEIHENIEFLGAGRILRNSGRPRGSLLNCYYIPLNDSIEEIGQFLKDCIVTWSEGGGLGTNVSFLRPNGAEIKTKGGESSGPVSFLRATNAVAETIKIGGARRAAGLALMEVSHPDILNFIDAKMIDGEFSNFNISVGINEKFIEAVEKNLDWELSFNNKIYNKIKARVIWDRIIDNMLKHAEPGLINMDNLRSNNSYYFQRIKGLNPCVTGDTLIAVADGRNYVPIKQLADEGKDVPVYSFNENEKKVEIQVMRNPRLTGYGKKIFKVNLDDGSFFRCTENHKIYMKNGTIKQVSDLKIGDRLNHMIKFHASFEEVFRHSNSKSQDYMWINHNKNRNIAEHRIIAEYKLGRNLDIGEVVHHKDRNGLNNNLNNIEIMSKKDHDKLHGLLIRGKNNPMNKYPEKNWLIKQDWLGNNNGRYKGYEPEQVFEIAVNYSKLIGRRIKYNEWSKFCNENNVPNSRYSIQPYNHHNEFLKEVAKKAGVYIYENSGEINSYEYFLELQKTTDLDIFYDKSGTKGNIFVRKICERSDCKKEFNTPWKRREQCFCSVECSNKNHNRYNYTKTELKQLETRENQIKIYNNLKFELKRDPMKKEYEKECKKNNIPFRLRSLNSQGKTMNKYCFTSYKELKKEVNDINYKVVSIEIDGYENVYNGTVDFNHNFYIMVNKTRTESKKIKYNHILNRQCGEACLPDYGCCDLGSIVLPRFTMGTKTNWKRMEEVIRLGIRFLDNVLDVNNYILQQYKKTAQDSRRIGLGVMGLADYFFAKQIRYGSQKSVEECERLFKFIRNISYDESIRLSEEKGSFPKFDAYDYTKAHFIRTLPISTKKDIKKYGIRNVTQNSIAPTGTLSLIADTTGGIEPLFSKAYEKRDAVSNRIYIHPIYKNEIIESGEKPDWFVDVDDLTPKDHLDIQVMAQRYVDASISKTLNFSKETKKEELSENILNYITDLKGMTIYVDGSRGEQPLRSLSEEEVKKYIKKEEYKMHADEETIKCPNGKCDI